MKKKKVLETVKNATYKENPVAKKKEMFSLSISVESPVQLAWSLALLDAVNELLTKRSSLPLITDGWVRQTPRRRTTELLLAIDRLRPLHYEFVKEVFERAKWVSSRVADPRMRTFHHAKKPLFSRTDPPRLFPADQNMMPLSECIKSCVGASDRYTVTALRAFYRNMLYEVESIKCATPDPAARPSDAKDTNADEFWCGAASCVCKVNAGVLRQMVNASSLQDGGQ